MHSQNTATLGHQERPITNLFDAANPSPPVGQCLLCSKKLTF